VPGHDDWGIQHVSLFYFAICVVMASALAWPWRIFDMYAAIAEATGAGAWPY
jgi:hypothetical protein